MQLLSFIISTVLETTTYLKFRYIKLKNAKQKEEEEKKKDKISEKVKPQILESALILHSGLEKKKIKFLRK